MGPAGHGSHHPAASSSSAPLRGDAVCEAAPRRVCVVACVAKLAAALALPALAGAGKGGLQVRRIAPAGAVSEGAQLEQEAVAAAAAHAGHHPHLVTEVLAHKGNKVSLSLQQQQKMSRG